MAHSSHVAARLDEPATTALSTIIEALSVPHRRPASASEAIRAAVLFMAATMPAAEAAPSAATAA